MDAQKNYDPQKRQGKKQQDRKSRKLFLAASIPKKTGDVWQVVVTATLKAGQNCHRGISVHFALGAKPSGHAVPTDESGNAKKAFILPSGEYTVFAEVEHGGPSSSINLTLKEAEKKPPAKLIVREHENPRGAYCLFFQVLTGNDVPVNGALIRITGAHLNEHDAKVVTDSNGTAKYPVTVFPHEKRKMVSVAILGSNLEKTLCLFS